MSFKEVVRSAFSFREEMDAPRAGVYHYRREENGSKTRLHLRIEGDGRGLLMVNANRAFHLNPSAALMAYLRLEGTPDSAAVRVLRRSFHVPEKDARSDYAQFCAQLETISHPDEHCPICEMDLEMEAPFSVRPSAPYRMDLAITYRCNNNCSHCYNARSRQFPELPTADWLQILDRLWQVGIPHVVFTGGEPTLRPDLPDLIAYAEGLGMITGINTNGRALKDRALVEKLVKAGLDHVQITLESHKEEIHNRMVSSSSAWQETVAGIRNVLDTPLYVMTNTTLLTHNVPYLANTLDFLAELQVPTVGLNALIYSGRGANVGTGLAESSLPPLLELARQKTEAHQQRLIWYTPTQYCHFDPVQMELGVKACTAALYNMCVEPDGSVIPCQSYYQPVGNILRDSWETLWNHDLSVSLRERRDLPEDCQACALLKECGGGCPLARQANSESSASLHSEGL